MAKADHFEADVDPKHCIKYRPTCGLHNEQFYFPAPFVLCLHLSCVLLLLRSGSFIWNAGGFFFNREHKLCFGFYIFCLNSTVAFKKN
jgi:hypothetical protein